MPPTCARVPGCTKFGVVKKPWSPERCNRMLQDNSKNACAGPKRKTACEGGCWAGGWNWSVAVPPQSGLSVLGPVLPSGRMPGVGSTCWPTDADEFHAT